MTKNKARKSAARRVAATTGKSYTAALRTTSNASSTPESPSELLARSTLEGILGASLERVTPDNLRPSPDYALLTASGRAGIEVKAIASRDWLSLHASYEKNDTERASSELSMFWLISLPAETAAERLAPTPDFPPDDEAQIARLAEAGLKVERRAERIAKFERRRQEMPKPHQVKGMIDDLIPNLQILEARGITTTRGPMPTDPEGVQAWRRVAERTRNAICQASPASPKGGVPAGVHIAMSHGHVRTNRADTLAARVQTWLASEKHSGNLVRSLDRDEYDQGHAVLVFDPLEPEFRSARDTNTFVPTEPLTLPGTVDVVWVLLGNCTLRYSAADGWSEYRTTPRAA